MQPVGLLPNTYYSVKASVNSQPNFGTDLKFSLDLSDLQGRVAQATGCMAASVGMTEDEFEKQCTHGGSSFSEEPQNADSSRSMQDKGDSSVLSHTRDTGVHPNDRHNQKR